MPKILKVYKNNRLALRLLEAAFYAASSTALIFALTTGAISPPMFGVAVALAAISVLSTLVTLVRTYAIKKLNNKGGYKSDFLKVMERYIGPLMTLAAAGTVFGGIYHAFRIGSLTVGTPFGMLGIAYLVVSAATIPLSLVATKVRRRDSVEVATIAGNLFRGVGVTSCLAMGCAAATWVLVENAAAIAQSPLLIATAVTAVIAAACVISNLVDWCARGLLLVIRPLISNKS